MYTFATKYWVIKGVAADMSLCIESYTPYIMKMVSGGPPPVKLLL